MERLLRRLIDSITNMEPFVDPKCLSCPRCRILYVYARIVEEAMKRLKAKSESPHSAVKEA